MLKTPGEELKEVHMNDHDRFYNDLSDRLGLPWAALREGWEAFGRRIIHNARPRFMEFGYPYYGIESTEVVPAVKQGPAKSMTPTLDKLEAEHDANAAMIARDGPAKPRITVDKWPRLDALQVRDPFTASTAHPSPFASFRSPDLCACTHQIDPAHQLKG